jgi:hypothetical protein
MRRFVCILAFTLSLAGAAARCAAQAARPILPGPHRPTLSMDQDALLHRLEQPDGPDRHAAEDQLDKLADDPANEPVLEAMFANTENIYAKDRLDLAMDRVPARQFLAPTLITLHFKNAPVKDVYAELFRQAQAPKDLLPDKLPSKAATVSIDVDKQPFWAVMQQLQEQTGLAFDGLYATQGKVAMVAVPDTIHPMQQVVGSVLVQADSLELNRNLFYGGAFNDVAVTTLRLRFLCEPRLHVVAAAFGLRQLQAVDDRGNDLMRTNVPGWPTAVENYGWLGTSALLTYPLNDSGKRIVHFRGAVRFTVAGATSHLEIDDILNAKPGLIADNGVAVNFEGCRKVGDANYELTFSFPPFPNSHARESFANSFTHAALFTADGKRFPNPGRSGSSSRFALHYGAGYLGLGKTAPVPAKFIWDVPADLHDVEVPVSFDNLDMDFTGPLPAGEQAATQPAASAPIPSRPPATEPGALAPTLAENFARFAAPSLITMHMQDVTARQVYDNLFTQAHLPDDLIPDPLATRVDSIDIDADKQPFWTVMKKLQEKTCLTLNWPFAAQQKMELGDQRSAGQPPYLVRGAMLVEAQGLWFNRSISYRGQVFPKFFALRLECKYEPRLCVVSEDPMVHVTEAVDDKGNSLMVATSPRPMSMEPRGWPSFSAGLRFPFGNAGKTIAHLCGTIRMTLAAKTAHIAIIDIMNAKPGPVAGEGLPFTFDGCQKLGGGSFYDVKFTIPPGHANDWRSRTGGGWGWVTLLGDDGKPFPSPAHYSIGLQANGSYVFRYPAVHVGAGEVAPTPSKFIWDLPADFHEIEIPIEFDNLNIDVTGP